MSFEIAGLTPEQKKLFPEHIPHTTFFGGIQYNCETLKDGLDVAMEFKRLLKIDKMKVVYGGIEYV
jgi:hypothetical protein